MLRANLKLSLLLAGAMATTQVPVHAFTAKEAVLPTVVAFGAVNAFLLSTKESDPNFKSRFNPSMVRNVRKMTDKEYYKNLWYLFWDEFIGQKSKSSKVKVNKEDGSLEVAQSAPAAGVCGKACDYLKSMKDAKGTLEALAILGGAYIWMNKNFFGAKEEEKKNKDNGIEINSDGPINITIKTSSPVQVKEETSNDVPVELPENLVTEM